MNPEDLGKMSDEELDKEIKKTREANKRAIDEKDRAEERKTLATLNMLEDERLDRQRKKNTDSKYTNNENLSYNSQEQGENSSNNRRDKQKDSKEDNIQDEEDDELNEDEEESSGDESENKSAQEISDDLKQKYKDKSKNKDEKGKKNSKNKEDNKKDSTEKSGSDTKTPGNKATMNKAGDTAEKTAEAAQKAKQAEQAAETAKNVETAAKTAKAAKAGTAIAATPVGWIILAIVIAIIIIIVLVGYISFFFTLPSLVGGRLGEFCNSIWKNIVGFITANTAETRVTKEQIIEVADYLEEMGFDLAGYGFLDVKEGGRLIAERGEGQAVKIKDGDKIVLEKDENGEITDISSGYILTYLANDNLTYMIRGEDGITILSVLDLAANIVTLGMAHNPISKTWGQGMIILDGTGEGLIKDWLFNHSVDVSIDREKKVMEVKNYSKNGDYITYTYDLDGWTGVYGKPLEFLLSLHLATMAPDFALDVATNENIETEVHMQFHPIEHKIEAFKDAEGKEKVIVGENDITGELLEQWGVMSETIYKPYITQVKKHWYTNFDYSHCYKLKGEDEVSVIKTIEHEYKKPVPHDEMSSEVDKKYGEDEDDYTQYVPHDEMSSEAKDILEYEKDTIDNDTDSEGEYQKEKMTIYLIETTTSDIIQRADPKRTDNSKYIREMLTQTPYYIFDGTGGSEEKQLLVNSETGTLNLDANSKRFLYALSILENVDSKDAKAILKMLKELLNDYGANLDLDDENSSDSQTEKVTEDLEEAVPEYDEEKEGQDVLSPYTGNITSISTNSIVIEAGIGTNEVKWEISGFNVDSSLKKGTIAKGDKIGTTIKGQKLRIVKKNSTGDTVADVTQGEIKPGDLTENSDITKMKKLTTVSELEKTLKNYGEPLGTMADELLRIQNETGVNALLIAGITITESSGGKNVQEGTNNWTGNMSDGKLIVYDTVEDCLRATANNIRDNYFGTGIKTFKELGNKYNPSNPSYGSALSSNINNYFAL